jgi:superfamily II DNA helicase RecQ
VGAAIRNHPGLAHVPILALTATAVPHVQQDIMASLHMHPHNTVISRQSFDRNNLKIRILPKHGIPAAMQELIATLNDSENAATAANTNSRQSTIVYAPTRNEVETLTGYLQQHVNVPVEAYHAGLSDGQRETAHTNFLTGQTAVIGAYMRYLKQINRVLYFALPRATNKIWHSS